MPDESSGETLIAALERQLRASAGSFGVRRVETHISWVLVTEHWAYKIKKPVRFGFLDFSSLDRRRHFCFEELRLNGRLAPALYLDVVTITGSPEVPTLDGEGAPIEYAVKLRAFDPDRQGKALLETGQLSPALIDGLAKMLADFHHGLVPAGPDSGFGQAAAIELAALDDFPPVLSVLPGDERAEPLRGLQRWTQSEARRLRAAFERRLREGFIRECHGDLHLDNLVEFGGRLTPFDAIEFSPKLRWIDPLSDLAFSVMDLDAHGAQALAWRLLNGYLQYSGDFDGMEAFGFYCVYRAMVRAKVAALRCAQMPDGAERDGFRRDLIRYVDTALRLSAPSRPLLVIMHGVSGSGKSHLAGPLAEALPAVLLRSDVERKRLAGLSPLCDSRHEAGVDLYTAEHTGATYARLAELAGRLLDSGWSVIVDACFLKTSERLSFAKLADTRRVGFRVLSLEAPDAACRRRILERQRAADDPSEATVEVLARQYGFNEALTEAEQARCIRCDGTAADAAVGLVATLRAV